MGLFRYNPSNKGGPKLHGLRIVIVRSKANLRYMASFVDIHIRTNIRYMGLLCKPSTEGKCNVSKLSKMCASL